MIFHYAGKYNEDPNSLPCREHKPGAVKFKEPATATRLAIYANIIGVVVIIITAVVATIRYNTEDIFLFLRTGSLLICLLCFLLSLLPHEMLHAICFKEDVYLYTLFSKGILFVVGPETMSKSRFIFMSLLPNIVLGVIPYAFGIIFNTHPIITVLGIFSLSAGAGDYINVVNAAVQMPKGARTYLYQFNSYWYMP